MEQRFPVVEITDSPLFSLPVSFSRLMRECSPDSWRIPSLVGTLSGVIGGVTPHQRFQSGSRRLLTSVSDSMQALMNLHQRTSDSSKVDGSVKSLSQSGDQKIGSGEEVRILPGVRYGLRDEGDISREAAIMRRWIEQLIDAGQEDEVFPEEEMIQKEMDEAWGKGKGKAL